MKATPETLKLRSLVEEHRAEIDQVFEQYGASNPRLFGSVARGDAEETSDIDIMVDLHEPDRRRLMRLAGMSQTLREILNVSVDVVTPGILKNNVSDFALKEAVAL